MTDAGTPSRLRAHILLVLLMLAAVFAYADLQIFALLATPIKHSFALSDASLGVLAGLALNVTMAIALIPVGILVDKVNRVRLLMAAAALWSLFTLLTGVSGGFWQLFVCRIGMGVAEAVVYPVAYSLIADLYAPRRRALAVSIYLTGTLAGASLATILTGSLIKALEAAAALHDGGIWDYPVWRTTFVLGAIPGLILVAMLALVREPARHEDHGVTGAQGDESFVRFFIRERALLGRLVAAMVLLQLGMASMFFWIPSSFTRMFGFSEGRAGEWLGAIFGMGSLSGIAIGTALTALLRGQDDITAPLRVFRIGAVLAACMVLLLPFAGSPYFLAGATIAFIASVYVGTTVAPTILMNVAPNHFRGRLISLQTLLLMGLTGVTPPLVGALSDHVFTGKHGLVLAFSAVAIPCSLAAPLLLIGIRRILDRYQGAAAGTASHSIAT